MLPETRKRTLPDANIQQGYTYVIEHSSRTKEDSRAYNGSRVQRNAQLGSTTTLSREVTNNEKKKNYHRNRNHPGIVSTILGDTEISDHYGRT